MFVLFKKRGFSEYISDTITFFKTFGKHYFKNYFIINGGFLLILMVLIYFIFKVYWEVIFSSLENPNANYLESYFADNAALFIGSLLLFVTLAVILSLLNFAFPVLYLQLIEKNNGNNFTTSDLIMSLKENFGRLLIFFLGFAFIIIPAMMVVFVLTFLMIFILIGIPLLFIIGPAFLAWMTLSFHDYLIQKTGFFESLKNGFNLVKQQFWVIVGTTFIMALLIQIIQGILSIIPYFIGIIFIFTTGNSSGFDNPNMENLSAMGILMAVVMVLSIVLSYFFNNFLIINQGLIYYSLREENENNTPKSQIDLIGSESE
ncbi:hypothetical protein [Flavobacterium maritimum]|uniref:hypothetical protein n=1 Tax=Flavobacterium maritimum TaxID=3149042 RepID=UPI0032B5138C